MIQAVRHTGIVVRDLEKSEKFYCSMGFVKDNHAIEEGSFIDTLVGMKNTKLEWVKLKAPDGYILELLQYHSNPKHQAIAKQESNQLGCSHLAFTVENIDIVCRNIKKNGGSIVNQPTLTDNKKFIVVYCHDIEGNLMEIVEAV
jgi:lactoylglutathione lyase